MTYHAYIDSDKRHAWHTTEPTETRCLQSAPREEIMRQGSDSRWTRKPINSLRKTILRHFSIYTVSNFLFRYQNDDVFCKKL